MDLITGRFSNTIHIYFLNDDVIQINHGDKSEYGQNTEGDGYSLAYRSIKTSNFITYKLININKTHIHTMRQKRNAMETHTHIRNS